MSSIRAAGHHDSPRVRRARETLAATEKLAGQAYTEAIACDEVPDALETGWVSGPRGVARPARRAPMRTSKRRGASISPL